MDNLNNILHKYDKLLKEGIQSGLESHIDTGTLYNSVVVDNTITSNDITFYLSMEDYGYDLNYGREPGTYAPVEPIREWVSRQLSLNDVAGSSTEAKVNSLAYVINKSIAEDGQPALNFIEDTVDRNIDDLGDDISSVYVDELLEEIFV